MFDVECIWLNYVGSVYWYRVIGLMRDLFVVVFGSGKMEVGKWGE